VTKRFDLGVGREAESNTMRPATRYACVAFVSHWAAAWLLLSATNIQYVNGQDGLPLAIPADDILAVDVARLADAIAVDQNPLAAQIRRQLEPMLKVELSFVNRAAQLNDDQRRALVVASLKWFDQFVADFVKQRDPNERLMWMQGMRGVMIGGNQPASDPREMIQRGVAEVVANTLPKERVAAYEGECARRKQFYREVAVANLVERVDEQLRLSSHQRLDVTEALLDGWEKGAVSQLEIFILGADGLPASAEKWIRPELSESQRRLLSRRNTLNSQEIFFGQVDGAPDEVIDDIDLNAHLPVLADEPPN
jgi:hypothetical protein